MSLDTTFVLDGPGTCRDKMVISAAAGNSIGWQCPRVLCQAQ